jgi:L-2-hydroxycarboxylate dehydrogenase (NAD+)
MPGAERVYTTGEKEHLASLDRTKNGVPINETLLEEINQIFKE